MTIELRKFPYPYQAALTICSDIDGTSLENFIEIHKFLNTNQNTLLGPGLKLPIGDSFWMYDSPEIVDHAFSYFKNLRGTPSPAATIIRDFIKAGILDVMHSYGNFETIGDFSRPLASQALEELEKHGLKIDVWTNHGGLESVQNIGQNSPGKGDINLGDITQFYHSDLLLNYGIKFYWDNEASLMTNVGQDCPAKFSDAYWQSPLYQGWRSRLKSMIKGVASWADHRLYPITNTHYVPWKKFDSKNELILSDTLRDSNNIYKFKRYGHGRFDWSDNLPYLLNDKVLAKLLSNKGFLILYIHLGDRKNPQDSLPLSVETTDTLRKIAQLYHSNKLWVTTTARLLKYNLMKKALKWTVKEEDQTTRIYINGILTHLENYQLLEEDLAGLTFCIPDDTKIELFFKNRPLFFYKNSVDSQGRYSITVPIPELEWPL